MPQEPKVYRYYNTTDERWLRTYPECVAELFRDDTFSYVTSLQVSELSWFERSRRNGKTYRVDRWPSAKVFFGHGYLDVFPKNRTSFTSRDAGFKCLVTAVRDDMNPQVEYVKHAKENVYDRYPSDIKDFFKNRYFEHIDKICVIGRMCYSKERKADIPVWLSVEAYSGEQKVINVKPPNGETAFRSFNAALRRFIAEAERTGGRISYTRMLVRSYGGEPDVQEVFKNNPRIHEIVVNYSNTYCGYVAWTFGSDLETLDLIKGGRDSKGEYRFGTPDAAKEALLQYVKSKV